MYDSKSWHTLKYQAFFTKNTIHSLTIMEKTGNDIIYANLRFLIYYNEGGNSDQLMCSPIWPQILL